MELLSNFAYALVIEPKRRLSVLSSAISKQEWRLLFVTNNLEKKASRSARSGALMKLVPYVTYANICAIIEIHSHTKYVQNIDMEIFGR